MGHKQRESSIRKIQAADDNDEDEAQSGQAILRPYAVDIKDGAVFFRLYDRSVRRKLAERALEERLDK